LDHTYSSLNGAAKSAPCDSHAADLILLASLRPIAAVSTGGPYVAAGLAIESLTLAGPG